ncbi:putative zn(2)-C6 fungal-type DNA-binding domain-containing protein [Septoria linicola]|nr:putative zn(2)-C6 fungal-type DNA-binding domain-containing protein [Septoria linicola]
MDASSMLDPALGGRGISEQVYEEEHDVRPAPKRARSSFSKSHTQASQHAEAMESSQSVLQGLMSEPLDYPRRRATIACEICRSRKSKCNGARPKCKLCTELNAECVYREPGVKLDAGDKLILERLAHIEGLLQSKLLNSVGSPSTAGGPFSPATSNTASEDLHSKRLSTSMAGSGSVPLSGFGISLATNISTMPKAHTTPALHLLQWPVIRDLVSRQCDQQVLMQLEMVRPALDLQPVFALDLDLAGKPSSYARAFFDKVNVWYAVVNVYTFATLCRQASAVGFRAGVETCIVLLVLALGQAAHSGHSISRVPRGQTPPGMDYFNAAWSLMPTIMIRNDVPSTQCHVLAAAYLMYLVRPLEAWNILCSASAKLQLLLQNPGTIPPQAKELSERIYWNILMIESDLLAELDLPHTGIVQLEESMRLPRSFPYDATMVSADDLLGDDDIWYFLAEIALRRLLNRVSHIIYSQKRYSIASLEPVVAELEFQLNQWYEGLPASIRFPRERVPAPGHVQTVLRLRYFACRTIIFRPYIQAVLGDESLVNEPGVRTACEKCLDACVRQLDRIDAHHEGHLPYLYQGVLSITSQTLLLMGATLSGTLSAMLPPKQQVDAVIEEVLAETQSVSHLAPSIELCSDIVREAEERRQVIMQRPK